MKRWHLARWAPIFPFRGMTKLSEIRTLRETSGFKKYIKERERERGKERKMCLALLIENGCDKIKDKQNNHCPL